MESMSSVRAQAEIGQWRRLVQALLDASSTVLLVVGSIAAGATTLEAAGAVGPHAFSSSSLAGVVGGATAYGFLAFGPLMLVASILGLDPRRGLLVAAVAALLSLAQLYAYDPYYLPTLRRPVDHGFWMGWPLLLIAASGVLIAVAGRHRRLAALGGAAVIWLALYDMVLMGLH